MRLTKAQRAANHDRIIEVAAKLFREKGVDGVGIDEIMAAAKLTHGAFYGHFPTKTALVAEASAYALDHSGFNRFDADDPIRSQNFLDLARHYLTTRHRDDPGHGCAIASMATDVGRQDDAVQESFANRLDTALADLASRLPGAPDEARREAIVNYATMVGAMVMARSVGKTPLSAELLDTVRERLEAGQS
jgi:TetR/AcrR family transcriptional repressor of nem operon